MTNDDRQISNPSREAPGRQAWEPMSLTRVGAFGDVLQGGTGKKSDGATLKM